MKSVEWLRQPMYTELKVQQGFKNFVFELDQIIDREGDPDVWIVFKNEPDNEHYYSLSSLLWQMTFDS